MRLLHEKHTNPKSAFITLTYRDSSLPPRASLVTTHWQQFAHRLRKRLGPFRFFHCGEYGDETGRPHLHAAIFGHSFEEDRTYLETTDQGDELYTSPLLNHVWGHGDRNPIGSVTFKSAAYIARYIMKKQTGKRAIRHYGEIVDTTTGEVLPYRKPEYITMSLKPGIGHDWIHKYMDEVYPRDEIIINGKAVKPPKYYDLQLWKVKPGVHQAVIKKRKEEAKEHEDNNTPDRLLIREELAEAACREFTRAKI